MRVHVAFTPTEAERAPVGDRRRRPPRDVDDRPGARIRLPPRALLRRDRGGACASGGMEEAVLGGERGAMRFPASTWGTRRASTWSRGPRRCADDDQRDARDRGRGRQGRARPRREPPEPGGRRGAASGGGDVEVSARACRGASQSTTRTARAASRSSSRGERSDAAEAASGSRGPSGVRRKG